MEKAIPAYMPFRNKIVAVIFGLAVLLLIIELVRRKKLREEYSWLWLLTGAVILVLTLWYDLLRWMTQLIGAVVPSSTIFFFAVLFLFLISLHFSVVISRLADRNKELAQQYSLLELELNDLKKELLSSNPSLTKTPESLRKALPQKRIKKLTSGKKKK